MAGHGSVTRKALLLRGFGLLLVMGLVGAACGSDSGGNKQNSAGRAEAGASAGASQAAAPGPAPDPVTTATPDTSAASPAAPAAAPGSSPAANASPSPAASTPAPGGKSAASQAPASHGGGANTPAAPGGGSSTPAAGASSQPARPAPGSPATPAAPIAGGTIKIGGINPLSGSLSLIGKPAEQAARAYFRSINDAGGVLGQKIDYIVEDDANDANRTRAAAEKLIERDQIFIMGPSFTPYSPDIVRFLESKGVPFIGWDGLIDKDDLPLTSPTTVTVAGATLNLADALFPYWVQKENIKRVGMFYTEYGPAVTLRNETRKLAKKLGVEIVKETPLNQQTNAFVPLLLDMQRANVDGIIYWDAADIFLKAIVQEREMKYKPRAGWIVSHGATNKLVPESCGSFCDGLRTPWNVFPAFTSNSAVDQMKATISRYYGDINHDLYTEIPYMAAKVVVDLLQKAGAVDRGKLLDAARQATAYDTGGFTQGPIDISPGKAHLGRPTIVARAQGSAWTKETDWLPPVTP